MYTLLLAALLLALLFDTAAAAPSPIDPILSAAPMEFPYPDPEHMLGAMCKLCQTSVDMCLHSGMHHFTREFFWGHPEWPQDGSLFTDVQDNLSGPAGLFTVDDSFGLDSEPSIDSGVYFAPDASPPPPPPSSSFTDDFERNLSGPVDPPVDSDSSTHNIAEQTQGATASEAERQPLIDAYVQQLNRETATTVKPSTVQYHVEDTYNVGDRMEQARRTSNRRQAPRPGGFPCPHEGCVRTFDRNCDVNRHVKTHLDRSQRPHRCPDCSEGFLYPKDLTRHKKKHTTMQGTLYCSFPGCSSEGFSRRDNLLRHQRKQHPTGVAYS